MPLAAARKIVVERDRFHRFVAQQAVGKMAADESGAARDEEALAHSHGLPFGRHALQQRMADQQMPKHGAQPLGMRRNAIGRERGNNNALFGHLARETAIAPHDAKNVRAGLGRCFERPDDVDRYVLLAAAAAHGEHQHAIARTDARTLQPGGEAGVPALVVGAGGELGDVVGGGVSFKTAQLAKIVDRVTGVSGRAANSQDEQPAAEFANVRETQGHAFDGSDVDLFQNCDGLAKECGGKTGG